jgi:hypothetical protein
LIRESGLYRYPTLEEKRLQGENPIDENNHALGALRYMVAGIDRVRKVKGAGQTYQQEPDAVRAPVDPESQAAYREPHPQTRYDKVEPEPTENLQEQRLAEYQRELTREHLREHGWERW